MTPEGLIHVGLYVCGGGVVPAAGEGWCSELRGAVGR